MLLLFFFFLGITAEKRRRAEVRGVYFHFAQTEVLVDGPLALREPQSAARSEHGAAAQTGSAQTHHCGNRDAFARPDLPGRGERSVWSPAFVHGSNRNPSDVTDAMLQPPSSVQAVRRWPAPAAHRQVSALTGWRGFVRDSGVNGVIRQWKRRGRGALFL